MMEISKPDAALFLRIAAIERFPGFDVAKSPPTDLRTMLGAKPLLCIYSLDSFRNSDVSWTETIGYRLFDGTREDYDGAAQHAAHVEAWLWQSAALPGANPVAATISTSGPDLVPDEREMAVLFGTVEMVIAGVYRPVKSG